ncbi:unnamed protein product [Phytomonas sp. Hart1]|nr:unnamed protein product [Phytomonas sp. Hart1]|eukprot:CCW71113.1 unnamed protein product [Phytomonas sp. isolate Hart1]
MYVYSRVYGNNVLGYFFSGFSWVPFFSYVGVIGNPIGSYHFTSLVRFVENTPFITWIYFEHTLLSTDEVQTVAAYCYETHLRNQVYSHEKQKRFHSVRGLNR